MLKMPEKFKGFEGKKQETGSKKKPEKTSSSNKDSMMPRAPEKTDWPDEKTAFELVELYVEHISKGHEKRRMGLDTIVNAYFYALLRIKRKNKELRAITSAVEKEEEKLEEKGGEFTSEASPEKFEFK